MDHDTASEEQNRATLAILSGAKVVVWDLSTSTDEVGRHQVENDVREFDPYPLQRDGAAVPISSLAWNHNQMVIATSSGISMDAHDNIVLLSSQSGEVLQSFQHDSEWKAKHPQQDGYGNIDPHKRSAVVKSVSFGGKSRYLCIGDESGAVYLWDLKKKITVRQFLHNKPASGFDSPPSRASKQVSLDPTHKYVLSLSPSALFHYNLREGNLAGILTLPDKNDGNDIDIDIAHFTLFSISDLKPDLCAVGTNDGRVYVHEITKYSPSIQSTLAEMTQRHSGDVTGLSFSPVYPDRLFSCGNDGMIFLHNLSNNTSQQIRGVVDTINAPIRSMSLHANGVTCAVGCNSGDVFVYDFQNPTNEGEIEATLLASFRALDPIHSLFFAPPPRQKDKQRQQSQTSNNEKTIESSFDPVTQSTTKNPAVDSKASGKQTPTETIEMDVTKQQKPPSRFAPASRLKKNEAISKTINKPRSPSPFQRRMASLTAKRSPDKRPQKHPLSPKKLTVSPVHDILNSRIPAKAEVQKSEKINTEEIREVVREEIEDLQDEMEEKLRNLHIDMINQFHQQSQELASLLSTHFAALEGLTTENQRLREENERLRRGNGGDR